MTLAHLGLRAAGDIHDIDAVRQRIGIATTVGGDLIGRHRYPTGELAIVAQTIALAVARPRASDRRRRRTGRGDGHAAGRVRNERAAGEHDEASTAGRAGIHRQATIERQCANNGPVGGRRVERRIGTGWTRGAAPGRVSPGGWIPVRREGPRRGIPVWVGGWITKGWKWLRVSIAARGGARPDGHRCYRDAAAGDVREAERACRSAS